MRYKVAVIQNDITRDKTNNLSHISELIISASERADIIVLPEMFNCPYNGKTFIKYAEEFPGETCNLLERLAKEKQCLIIGGSIPELEGVAIYNTTYVYGPMGFVAKYRKMYLFDVDIIGQITFKESDYVKAGNDIVVFEYENLKIGLSICYDIRFPELARALVDQGAQVIVVPAAFNTTTGPIHWALTARGRAVDNQVYYIMASPARSESLSYKAYGHSMIVSPWGEVLSEGGIEETIIYGEVDTEYISKIRKELPLLQHRKQR
ncbi:MAG: carbon-nitrogen hydrolase family protein [Clostridia bacterium]|nr:carbon-nitrogen hydrolase family protein [Clostridia bacterium]